ncbi:MAG TPA: uracil-DNA glycosylase [bacterium]|nr:uracil-DNA glycosylase [bacterium]
MTNADLDTRIRACDRCPLRSGCRSPIPGDGHFGSRILFIGEAPGKNEDIEGVPFVGRSGKLLTSILQDLGLERERDYYITNIVKCRPPDNRDPSPAEIAACSGYLVEQLELMRPDVIVTLGRFSFNFLVPNRGMTQSRGQCFRIHGVADRPLSFAPVVLACYHPAVALYDPKKRGIITEDLSKLPEIIASVQL